MGVHINFCQFLGKGIALCFTRCRPPGIPDLLRTCVVPVMNINKWHPGIGSVLIRIKYWWEIILESSLSGRHISLFSCSHPVFSLPAVRKRKATLLGRETQYSMFIYCGHVCWVFTLQGETRFMMRIEGRGAIGFIERLCLACTAETQPTRPSPFSPHFYFVLLALVPLHATVSWNK